MIQLYYESNNSGGDCWLSDEDWKNLEKAGWNVHWIKKSKFYDYNKRWLGALAISADKMFNSKEEGIQEFEKITEEDAEAEGCSCCGPPHYFKVTGEIYE